MSSIQVITLDKSKVKINAAVVAQSEFPMAIIVLLQIATTARKPHSYKPQWEKKFLWRNLKQTESRSVSWGIRLYIGVITRKQES